MCVRFVCLSVTGAREWVTGPLVGDDDDSYRDQAINATGFYTFLSFVVTAYFGPYHLFLVFAWFATLDIAGLAILASEQD